MTEAALWSADVASAQMLVEEFAERGSITQQRRKLHVQRIMRATGFPSFSYNVAMLVRGSSGTVALPRSTADPSTVPEQRACALIE